MSLINVVLFSAVAILASILLPAAAWVLARGRAAATRHLIFTGVFAILIALPLAAVLLPSQMNFLVPAAPPVAGPVVATAPAAAGFDLARVVLAVVAVWFGGVLFLLARLGIAAIGLGVLYRRSVAHIPQGITEAPFRGLHWQLRLRTSPDESGPLTFGIVRPIVLLPKASLTWTRDRLLSVLLHEAAHVRRKDCLSRLIAALGCALYWPNPLVWVAARMQRAEAERAADDAVLSAGVKPSAYAAHLVGLAREFSGLSLAMTLSMAERKSLDGRVEAILDPHQSRIGVSKMDVLKLGAAAVALTAAMALVRPSLAEAPAPAEAPAAMPTAKDKPVEHRIVKTDGHHRTVTRIVLRGDDDVTPPPPPAIPPVPHLSDVPPVPPAPPAPPAVAVPPEPPEPPMAPLNVSEKAAIRAKAHAEASRAVAEARRALANVNIRETVANAMKQAEQAMRDAHVSQEQAHKALARMDIDRVVADAMKKAELALRQAEQQEARADREHGVNVIVETDD